MTYNMIVIISTGWQVQVLVNIAVLWDYMFVSFRVGWHGLASRRTVSWLPAKTAVFKRGHDLACPKWVAGYTFMNVGSKLWMGIEMSRGLEISLNRFLCSRLWFWWKQVLWMLNDSKKSAVLLTSWVPVQGGTYVFCCWWSVISI